MAAAMVPGSKLTDIWGRERCFVLGLLVYGVGGLLALLSFGLPQLIVGYSLLEGVGSALLVPPIYILVTVAFPDVKSRARYFGVVSAAGGLGVPVRGRGRGPRDVLGPRGPLQLPPERPGWQLRPCPERLEPRLVPGHGPGRLGTRGRQAPRREAVRRRPHGDARAHPHRPG